jgi:hypothetical protein
LIKIKFCDFAGLNVSGKNGLEMMKNNIFIKKENKFGQKNEILP